MHRNIGAVPSSYLYVQSEVYPIETYLNMWEVVCCLKYLFYYILHLHENREDAMKLYHIKM